MKEIALRISLFILICGICPGKSWGQEDLKRKSIYLELGGSGIIGSVNYDFLFKPGNDGLGMRVGLGFVPNTIVVPIGLNGLIGKKKVAFEYGAGISAAFIFADVDNLTFNFGSDHFGFIGYGKVGMRISPKENGVVFNIHWNPVITAEKLRLLWFGLGIGYSWKKKYRS